MTAEAASSLKQADLAIDDLQDLRSHLKFRMAEAKGDNDFLVVGQIKADQEPFSGELDVLQRYAFSVKLHKLTSASTA
jgi:hypothetical protein